MKMFTRPRSLSIALLASTLLCSAAYAAEPAPPGADGHDDSHADDAATDEIVVAGHPPIDFTLMASTATLEGDMLTLQTRGQLGDSLASLPGVSATSFSPGASRPVLRGLDGDRIRVLTDGIGTIDASSVSADHAVVFDPLTVDHIDVLHGPAVLLFGGQAIGGAVNALDKRIPRRVPEAITVTALAGYGSAADERSAGAAIDVPLGDRFVAHVDGSWRKSDDLRVGGMVLSAPLRSELLSRADAARASGDDATADDLAGAAALDGRVPNSETRSFTYGAGLAFIDAGGNLGVSFQHQDMLYGIPLRPGTGESTPVSIDLVQTRVDARGEVKIGGVFDALQIRAAYGDYRHAELEGDEIGTVFAGRGLEARADLLQANRGGWRGRSGLTYAARKLTIAGDEAIIPDNAITRLGFFSLQSYRTGPFEFEASGRFERASVRANAAGFDRSFDLWSGGIGASYAPVDGLKLGISFIRGARAPAPEELLTNGLHVATQAFEIGNPDFRAETSKGYEAYLRYDGDRANFALTGYLTDFDGFIAVLPTGDLDEGFPVFRYTQLPARFKGIEASGEVTLREWEGGALKLDASADYTHAQLKNVGPVPRIPPLRLRGGMDLETGSVHLRGEVEWNARQPRVGAFEYPVESFTLVNLSADWHPLGEDGPLTLLLAANNLFDVDARRAASFTRDFVPLPGRDLRITAKLAF